MILPDVNILLYRHSETSAHYDRVTQWVNEYIGSGAPILLAWPVIWGFVRISTNRSSYTAPISGEQALTVIQGWLDLPQTELTNPGARHLQILDLLIAQARVNGPRVSDAVLAALAVENHATLVSTDNDFRRFPGLQLINPLND